MLPLDTLLKLGYISNRKSNTLTLTLNLDNSIQGKTQGDLEEIRLRRCAVRQDKSDYKRWLTKEEK